LVVDYRAEEQRMMKLAMSGTGDFFQGASVTKLLEAAQRYQVDHIELWFPKNTKVEGLERSIALIRKAGIYVAAVSTWTHLYWPGDVAAQQALLLEGIELAHRLGARFANTYFGHGSVQNDDLAIASYIENLQPCLERAAALGVTICLENEFDVLGDDPQASDITRRPQCIRKLIERVDSPHFRLTFDACNFYFAGVESYPYAYELLKDYIVYVHLKDGTRYDPSLYSKQMLRFTDHSGEYVCLSLGQGAINYQGFLTRLLANGYTGFVTLEPHVEPARMEETYQQTLAYLRASEFLNPE
jgi:sugar phosphate isomerase/epimerase